MIAASKTIVDFICVKHLCQDWSMGTSLMCDTPVKALVLYIIADGAYIQSLVHTTSMRRSLTHPSVSTYPSALLRGLCVTLNGVSYVRVETLHQPCLTLPCRLNHHQLQSGYHRHCLHSLTFVDVSIPGLPLLN